MKLHLDCQTVSQLISAGMDQDLPASQRARLRLHFVMCRACRNVDEQMQFIRLALRRMDRLDLPGEAPADPATELPVNPGPEPTPPPPPR